NAQARWVAQPVLPAGTAPNSRFDLDVQLDAPMALRDIRSATHAIQLQQASSDAAHATVRLREDSAQPPHHNRDFVLDWRLAGEGIASGLMLYQGPPRSDGKPAENFFLAMVEPPASIAASAITPRDYVFVVDISGSMHGFPLD